MIRRVTPQYIPVARRDDLVVQELRDEVLVYDLSTHKAHCLNKAAALVLKYSDGETSVPALAAVLSRELSVAVDEAFVWIALDELQKHHLLQNKVSRAGRRPGILRRDAMKWALASAAALPLVTSIAAPAAAQTVSCVPDNGPSCPRKPNGNNDEGICTASSECCSCCCQTDTGDPSNAHCTNSNDRCLPG
jgi:hypothetical protein